MSSQIDEGRGTTVEPPGLTEILIESLKELAAADRAEAACRLAGRACATLRQSDPTAWNRFNVLLHRLARQVP